MFHVNHNLPGCLPEADGADLPTWRDAVEYAAREIRTMADEDLQSFDDLLDAFSSDEGMAILQAEGAAVEALRAVKTPQPVSVQYADRVVFIAPAE